MRILSLRRAILAAASSIALACPAAAQVAPTTDPAVVPPPVPAEAGGKRVFLPADFARFAPKTAYDMLVQVPGFTIRSAVQERGLGQASENVLLNGQRIANKSGGAIEELQRVGAANVDRIEIVDAASLGIAGLSGAVANVIVNEAATSSGQFEWEPDFRAHYAEPRLYAGSVSYTGQAGAVGYTLSVKNNSGRGAFGGPIEIFDASGLNYESRHDVYHGETEQVTMSSRFAVDGPGSSLGNLTLAYTPYWSRYVRTERRIRLDGDHLSRTTRQKLTGWYYDISGDYEFAAGPGRLKLIGVRHWKKEPLVQTQVTQFDSGVADEGVRFVRDSRIAETIGRAEYSWKGGSNDWQISFERAYNSLDQRGGLFELSPEGEFEEVDFPEGTGHVTETRYESIATLSRPLGSTLNLQIAAGAEHSTLERLDGDLPPRKFFRPKGSINLGWQPSDGWEASLKLRRSVGQISFYDFLDQPKLVDERENAGNPDLVPPQSWEVETEIARDLGAWGNTRLKAWYHRVQDIIDVIPIGEDGQGIGNLPSATRLGIESTSTLLLDRFGWRGAKLDLTMGLVHTRVRDPLTGDKRPISGTRDRWAFAELRHDVPGTDYAWGVTASHDHFSKNYFLTEVFRSWEGPWWVGVYAEHKDIFGLTVRASAGNLLNARHLLDRTVYLGRRTETPIDFIQRNDQLIGPIFSFSVRGSF